MATFYKEKDPSAALDYTFNWAQYLTGGATVASGGTTVTSTPSGLTISAPTVVSPNVTARISGGTAGTEYDVVCHAVLSTGETDDRTLRLIVVDK